MKTLAMWLRKTPIRNSHLLSLLGVILLLSCGIPNTSEIPTAPVPIDDDDSDNLLSFSAPPDNKIDRYIIWYKIYPYVDRTSTEDLVSKDYDYFNDLNIRSSADIRKRDFHELRLDPNPDTSFYLENIAIGTIVEITRVPDNHTNYIQVAHGSKSYNVRRNVAVSTVDNSRKKFYDSFHRTSDADIRSRTADFSAYSSLDQGFAIAFLAQSAYIDPEELEIITSEVATLGIIYSTEGFINS